MSQIEELQSRITAAMDRIGAGIEALAAAPVTSERQIVIAPDGDADLAALLEDERMANAQLEERLKTLKARHAEELEAARSGEGGDTAALEAELEELRARAGSDDEAEGLRAELAEVTARLTASEEARAALEEAGTATETTEDNEALKAEIDALKAQLDAAEDPEPLKAELEQMEAQADNDREEREALHAEVERLRGELAETEQLDDLRKELDMLRAERVSHGEAMARLDSDLQRLRKANDQLRGVNAALREANAAGLGDAELIENGREAELEALRAVRETDAAEARVVLARLEPLLAQASLAEGEDE